MIDQLRRLVAIHSLSRQEEAIASTLVEELGAEGFEVRRQANNLWLEVGDAPRPRLLLCSHLDTVPPTAGWTVDPWTPRLDGDRLTGLGSNDAKGCVTAMLQAVRAVSRSLAHGEPLGGMVVLALVAEEEISGQSLSAIREQLEPIDAALIGEPTRLTPMIAQRGLLILKCQAQGRARHAGNSPPGAADNAILTAARDLLALESFDWGPTHPTLGTPHGNVTTIAGGVARNVIPDRCEFFLDIRTTPLESHQQLRDRLAAHLTSEVLVHSDRLVPIQTSPDEPIVQAILRALPGTVPSGSPTMSDMVHLAKIPTVKIGPGDSSRSHTADEYLMIDELKRGAAAYERVIREYLGQSR
jgi:acetylornithine deacetylase